VQEGAGEMRVYLALYECADGEPTPDQSRFSLPASAAQARLRRLPVFPALHRARRAALAVASESRM